MFHSGTATYEDVMLVDEDTGDASEYGVHESLECLSSILESEQHAEKFPEAK